MEALDKGTGLRAVKRAGQAVAYTKTRSVNKTARSWHPGSEGFKNFSVYPYVVLPCDQQSSHRTRGHPG